MDRTGFDRLCRLVGVGSTRRAALKTVFGGATLAAVGAHSAASETTASKHKKQCRCKAKKLGETCTSNKQCCTNETDHICSFKNGGGLSLRCCGALGASCRGDTDCCNSFGCGGGTCGLVA